MAKPRKAGQQSARISPIKHFSLLHVIILAVGLVAAGLALLLTTNQNRLPEGFVPETQGAPRLSVDQDSIDFGDVKVGKNVEAIFRVRNVGDQPLRILDTEPPLRLVEGC